MADPTTASPAPETGDRVDLLLSTAKVGDFKVYSRDGEHLGHLQQLMLNKRSGAATYAVLALGGFLGIGKSYYPLPFSQIDYDRVNDRYTVLIDKRVLEGGPSWASNPPTFDQPYADRVSSYYGQPLVDLSA